MKERKHKSLKGRFIRGLLLTFLFLLVLCFLSGVSILRLRNDIIRINKIFWPTADSAMEFRLSFLQKLNGINTYLSGNIIEGKEILFKADARIAKEFKSLDNQDIIEKNQIEFVSELIRQFQGAQEDLLASHNKALEQRRISLQFWDVLVLGHKTIHDKYEEGKISFEIDLDKTFSWSSY